MGTILDVCDLRGPLRTTLRTPWGSMVPRLRTYALIELLNKLCVISIYSTRLLIVHCIDTHRVFS